MIKPLHLISELIFPPRCAACGKLRVPKATRSPSALCESCAAAFARELHRQCPTCFLAYHACRCAVPHMQKKGVLQHVKLASYKEEEGSVAKHLILRLKEHVTKEAVTFLASELAPGVRATLEAMDRENEKKGVVSPRETVVTFLPRPKLRRRRAGFDQSAEIAKALARELGLPYRVLLKRVGYGAPQKLLSRGDRIKSIKGAFAAKGDASGLRVLLVDDLVTTGADMGEGAAVLCAAETVAVSIAVTEKRA